MSKYSKNNKMKKKDYLLEDETNKILNQIEEEYQAGYSFVKEKRVIYYNRLEKYGSITRTEKKQININSIYRSIDKLIAKGLKNKPTVSFSVIDTFINDKKTKALNSLAFNDMQEQDFQQIDYQAQQDKYFFGIGLKLFTHWDNIAKKNVFIVIDPLTWIPDPIPCQNGKFNGQDYKFHGFSTISNISSLKAQGFDEKKLFDYAMNTLDLLGDDMKLKNRAIDLAGGYLNDISKLSVNFPIEIYYHYTEINGIRKLFILSKDRKSILKTVLLKPYLKCEIGEGKVKWPISISYFKPKRKDPFGFSVCDLIEDKEIGLNKLENLNLIKAQKESLGGDFLYNARLINNINSLKNPTIEKRYIPVASLNPGETLESAMLEVPSRGVNSSFELIKKGLQNEIDLDLGFDQDTALGNASMSNIQASLVKEMVGTSKKIIDHVNFWGEKEFRLLRYKGYLQFFSQNDSKLIKDDTDVGFVLKRSDFVLNEDPRVVLFSATDKQNEIDTQKAYMNAQLPMILQDPLIADVSKKFAKRYTYRLNGWAEKQIMAVCPYSADERKAQQYLEMVNYGKLPLSLFDNEKADFFIYYFYINSAFENSIKYKVLHTLEEYLIASDNVDYINKGSSDIQDNSSLKAFNKTLNANNNILMNNAIQKKGFE